MTGGCDMRIVAQWQDDPTEARMIVDARIEDARIVATWDIFGAFDLDGATPRPFILRRDGGLDFGGSESWRTDMREAEIRVGVQFNIFWNDQDSGAYQIVKIATLGART